MSRVAYIDDDDDNDNYARVDDERRLRILRILPCRVDRVGSWATACAGQDTLSLSWASLITNVGPLIEARAAVVAAVACLIKPSWHTHTHTRSASEDRAIGL